MGDVQKLMVTATQEPPRTQGFFSWFPWEKFLIWGLVVLTVYALRHFFFVIFMTFMISYIMRNVVRGIMKVLSPKTERVWLQRGVTVIAFVLLLAVLSGIGFFLYHPLKKQATGLYNLIVNVNIEKTFNEFLRETVGAVRFRAKYGPEPEKNEKNEEYKKDLAEYETKHRPRDDSEKFIEKTKEFDEAFRASAMRDLGEDAYRTLKNPDFAFQAWLMNNIEPAKIEESKPELIKEYERPGGEGTAWMIRNNVAPEDAQNLKTYQEARDQFVLGRVVEKELRENKEKRLEQYKTYLGDAAFAKLPKEEIEARRETFYGRWLEKGRLLPEAYQRFAHLRSIPPEALQAELTGGTDGNLPKEDPKIAFWKYKTGELAKEVVGTEQIGEILNWIKKNWLELGKWVAGLGLDIVNLLIQFGFSLLLSFFIVFDLFRLRRMFQGLEGSRIRSFYNEIAPGLIAFGRLIGRSFQAQGVIAVCNTLLTFAAVKALGIQNEIFLAGIVFICSFIPILGVVISSVPIAAMALIQEAQNHAPAVDVICPGCVHNGLILALLAVGAILVVHFIETSILNPKIVGDMLHLHPVMVLAILAVGEYFFGVWGLLLGVPVAVYIFRYAILGEPVMGIGNGISIHGPPARIITQDPIAATPPAPRLESPPT